jgi:hypothetical protein
MEGNYLPQRHREHGVSDFEMFKIPELRVPPVLLGYWGGAGGSFLLSSFRFGASWWAAGFGASWTCFVS